MAAVVAAPAIAIFAGLVGPAPSAVADCPGDVNMNILSEGAPITSNCPVAPAPGPSIGAPSQDLLTRCAGVPGCLSANLYGPGNVQVPNRNTTVHQSQ